MALLSPQFLWSVIQTRHIWVLCFKVSHMAAIKLSAGAGVSSKEYDCRKGHFGDHLHNCWQDEVPPSLLDWSLIHIVAGAGWSLSSIPCHVGLSGASSGSEDSLLGRKKLQCLKLTVELTFHYLFPYSIKSKLLSSTYIQGDE